MIAFTYVDDDGSTQVATCSHMSSVPPESVGYEVEPPVDSLFRSAWEIEGGQLVTNLAKAKEIAHDKRRAKRAEEFAPHDDVIKLGIPGQDSAAAEEARAAIRDRDSERQAAIDACSDEAELRAVIEAESVKTEQPYN